MAASMPMSRRGRRMRRAWRAARAQASPCPLGPSPSPRSSGPCSVRANGDGSHAMGVGDEVGGRRPQRRRGPGAGTPARGSAWRAVGARAEARLSRGKLRARSRREARRARGWQCGQLKLVFQYATWHVHIIPCPPRTNSARRPLARKRGGMPSCHLSAYTGLYYGRVSVESLQASQCEHSILWRVNAGTLISWGHEARQKLAVEAANRRESGRGL